MEKASKNLAAEYEQQAQAYAWNHFVFHAQQRQTVFNFYLLLVAGSIAAYATTLSGEKIEYETFRFFMGLVLALASLLFWRLDQRSAKLVKISENALKHFEGQLAQKLGNSAISLMRLAEVKSSKFPLSSIESFGQIYRLIFTSCAIVGLLLAIHSAFSFFSRA